jgi:hypothetical protein
VPQGDVAGAAPVRPEFVKRDWINNPACARIRFDGSASRGGEAERGDKGLVVPPPLAAIFYRRQGTSIVQLLENLLVEATPCIYLVALSV